MTGSTGYWKVNPRRCIDRVFIHHRGRQEASGGDLYEAIISGFERRLSDGRYRLTLRGIRDAGRTEENWQAFASASQNPIRYVTRSPIGA